MRSDTAATGCIRRPDSGVEGSNVVEKPSTIAQGGQPAKPQEMPPQDAAYLALHAERETLEHDLLLAQQQQRFGATGGVEQARQREAALLKDLDRVLTQIRAAEVRRRPGAKRW